MPQILPFRPFFDISIIYAKYLARNSGSATEMIINIILVDDFVTLNVLNCKNLTIETRYTKMRYLGKVFSKACLHSGPSFSDYEYRRN